MANKVNLIPLWEFQPEADRYSIGWRMGAGEDYVSQWWSFYNGLSEQEREAYRVSNPEPKGWEGFYKNEHPHWGKNIKYEFKTIKNNE